MPQVFDVQHAPGVHAHEQTIAQRIFAATSRVPHSVLFYADGNDWTAGRLANDARRLAHGMLALGLKPGDRVVTQLANRPEACVIFAACFAAGVIVVPLNPEYKPAEVLNYLSMLRPSLYFCEAKYFAAAAGVPSSVVDSRRRFIVGEDTAHTGLASWETLKMDTAGALPTVDPHAPAVLIHTSGTTGNPKFVVHTNASLNEIVDSFNPAAFNDQTRFAIALSPYFISGFAAIVTTMARGMCLALLDGFDPDAMLDAVEKYRCTGVGLTPYQTSSLNDAQRARPRRVDSLKLCTVGGDVCHPAIMQAFAEIFRQPLYSLWGMSEGIGTVSVGSVPGAFVAAPDCFQLVDDNGHEVRDGEAGEFIIRGGNLFKGYWLGPDQIDDGRRNGWFHTGDIMRKDADGNLHFVARKKDVIVTAAINVAPAEVERELLTHPVVAEAAVIGVADDVLGQRVIGFVVLRDASRTSADEVLDYLKTRLVGYKVPERLIVLDEIPRTGMGKAIRPRLQEHAAQALSAVRSL
jgi:long-chain acyl-CoA synthetase